ncbi:MAG: GntR family transcriptional regulator [Clostridia bacterium]|nr:GntR family transcriptional regulator [Clostridia bacterium]
MDKVFSGKRDVYLEIAERYEKYITLGVIKPGEKLPSVRTAATELRVNPNTVQRAYTLLEERGFIRSMPKKGAFAILPTDSGKGSETLKSLTDELIKLKGMGVSKEDIIFTLEEVYKDD